MQKHSPFDSLTAEVRIAEKSPDPNQLVTSDHTDLAVRRSWQRCMANYGLEPHHTPPPSVLTQSELKDILARSDELISFASFEIDRLFAHIGPSDYVVMLTDMRGVTVDFRCTPPLRGNARKAGLYLGSIWSESEQGTNGVGTCVFETRPLSIVRGEHFAARNAALTCTVAPIFAAENRLAGILDVSTEQTTNHAGQAIMRQMVAAAAQRIENSYFAHRHVEHSMVRLSLYRDFADSAAEARLALADNGTVLEAGSNASRLLARDAGTVAGVDISSLLHIPLHTLLAAEGPLEIQVGRGQSVYARLEERPHAKTRTAGGHGRSARTSAPNRTEVPRYNLATLAGDDPAMLTNVDIARRMIDRGLPIVITGETGSGKGLFAHALHAASARAAAPFVTVNCAAIPQDLIESELFGYRAGAFTGASAEGFKGRLLQANTGTLFLDEIGDMALALQTRLLQVLSDREFTPIGATRTVLLDVAVVSATLHDLPQRVRMGQFREDLFFRLSGVTVTLPALRHRSDRAALIRRVFNEEAVHAQAALVPDESTIAILVSYFWPGNLRELRHVARFAVALAEGRGDVIYPQHLPPPFGGSARTDGDSAPRAPEGSKQSAEAHMILAALDRAGWNITAAAAVLDISRATLHRKIRKHGLQRH